MASATEPELDIYEVPSLKNIYENEEHNDETYHTLAKETDYRTGTTYEFNYPGAEYLHLRSLSISEDNQSGVHVDYGGCYSHGENEATIDDLIYKMRTMPPEHAENSIKYIHSTVIPKACQDRDIHSLVKLLCCQNSGIETRSLEEISTIFMKVSVNTHKNDTLFESMKTLHEVLEQRIADAENILPIALSMISTLFLQSLNHPDSINIAAMLKSSAKQFEFTVKEFQRMQQCSGIQEDLVNTLDTMLKDIDKMVAKPSCLKLGNWDTALLDKRRLEKLEKELAKNMTFLEQYSCLLIVIIQLYRKPNLNLLSVLVRCVQILFDGFTRKVKYMHLLYPTVHFVAFGIVKLLEKHDFEELLDEKTLNTISEQLCGVLDLFMTNKKTSRERKSKLLDTVQKVMFYHNVCVSKTIVSHMEKISTSLVYRTMFHTQHLLSQLSFVTPYTLNTPPESLDPMWHTFYGDILSNTDVTLHILLPSKQCLLSGGTKNYKDKTDKEQTRSHENAVEILRHLGGRRIHGNVIRLLAYQLRPIPFFYVVERPNDHSLLTFLLRRRSNFEWFPIKSLVAMAVDMINAVSFIHKEGVIHRNLTCCSFSIRGDLNVVLVDFSLSQLVDDENYVNFTRSYISDVLKNKIPARWSAPESLFEDKYDVYSDTWMFGQLLYELFTHGCHPYTELYGHSLADIMGRVIFNKLKPHRWPCIPRQIHDIILSCVESEPAHRISVRSIRYRLEESMAYETPQRSRMPKIRKVDSREQLYPKLDDRNQTVERGLPISIRELKAQLGDKRVSYYNMRKSTKRLPEKLAISESDLAAPDTPSYRVKNDYIEVEEPVTPQFMEDAFPAFTTDVRSCLLMVSQWPLERQQRESSQHGLSVILRYKCQNGMSLLDIASTKKYGDPLLSPEYLDTIWDAISFVERMHSKNLILRDICCSTLFRSYDKDQAVFMPRIGRFMHVKESTSTDGCIVDTRCLELYQNRRNWLPLEVLRFGQFSKDSDIYMLGMTIYEFFKATELRENHPKSSRLEAVPFATVVKEKLLDNLTSGELLDEPDNCPFWLWQEVLKCLDRDHTKRLSAAELLETFNKQPDFDDERAEYTCMNDTDTLSSDTSSTVSLGPPLLPPRNSTCTSRSTSISSVISFGNTSDLSALSFDNTSESCNDSSSRPTPSQRTKSFQSTDGGCKNIYAENVQKQKSSKNTDFQSYGSNTLNSFYVKPVQRSQNSKNDIFKKEGDNEIFDVAGYHKGGVYDEHGQHLRNSASNEDPGHQYMKIDETEEHWV